jgi:acyl-CoA thioesterase-1
MKNTTIKDSCKILISGDSISRGVIYDETRQRYITTRDNYVSMVQDSLKGIICNTAKFGNTITKGLDLLKKSVLSENPDIALIEFGGNDCDFNWDEIAENPFTEHHPKTDLSLFEKVLRETVSFLDNKGIIPVLTTLPPLNADKYLKWVSKNSLSAENNILKWLGSVTKIYWWHERYNSIILKIAAETRTRLIDIRGAFLSFPDFTKLICIDGIHPNKEGHKVIAEKILDFIKMGYGHLLNTKNVI